MSRPASHRPEPLGGICHKDYDQRARLTQAEKRALSVLSKAWTRFNDVRVPLMRLVKPLEDALEVIGASPNHSRAAMTHMLRECRRLGKAYWAWSQADWLDVLGSSSRRFASRLEVVVGQCVRLDVVAIAYVQGWYRDILSLGRFRREPLAMRVFGEVCVREAIEAVLSTAVSLGFSGGMTLRSTVCEALLINQSPRLQELTASVLSAARELRPLGQRSTYHQLGRILAALGFLEAPLPIASARSGFVRENLAQGVGDEWASWVERWAKTSTRESTQDVRFHLYKVGRWLNQTHPHITSPGDWDRALAAEYVSAINKMRVGEFTVRRAKLRRAGQPLLPRAKQAEFVAIRTFFTDCQEWEWIPRRFDPARSLRAPRAVRLACGPEPRVIADDVWARLMWAGLNLTPQDLPTAGNSDKQKYPYPIEYVRGVALVWLFAGLRSDEIARLRVGCVRWQAVDAAEPVCLLDVPVNKTGSAMTKPVDSPVGRAIEAWESVRLPHPPSTDRKTGEQVNLLFSHRGRPLFRQYINDSLIPILCRKGNLPSQDVRGPITSHRARATIASQLFNARQPMSLSDLQQWLGHASPTSTQHYVAVTPTKLARSFRDAGYFERNVRAIDVLIDRDAARSKNDEPWRYYDLGHGLCSYDFFDQCPHRMACARCDFYLPKKSTQAQLLESKRNLLRVIQEIPLTENERAAVDGDLEALEQLQAKLKTMPPPHKPPEA